jgi:hypothetical protein
MIFPLSIFAAESQSITTSEIPTFATDSKLEVTTPISDIDKGKNKGHNQYAQEVLIGMTVAASVLGVTQVLLILAVVLLTVALVKVYKKHKKDVTEPPHQILQTKTNDAYGVHEAASQQTYDYNM